MRGTPTLGGEVVGKCKLRMAGIFLQSGGGAQSWEAIPKWIGSGKWGGKGTFLLGLKLHLWQSAIVPRIWVFINCSYSCHRDSIPCWVGSLVVTAMLGGIHILGNKIK